MSDNRFDHIAYEILKQKQMMDELIAENRDLHRQIADLRTGRGIFIDIAGQRFPLKDEIAMPQVVSTVRMIQSDSSASPTSAPPLESAIFESSEDEDEDEVNSAPTVELEPSRANTIQKIPEQEPEQPKVPTFLEEIMIDEFVTASTSPMSVWKGPIDKQEPEQIDEEQKAALRRELMGSFLLE